MKLHTGVSVCRMCRKCKECEQIEAINIKEEVEQDVINKSVIYRKGLQLLHSVYT